MKTRFLAAGFTALLTLGVAAACGDDSSKSADSGMEDMDSHTGNGQYSFGAPGDPAQATKTVEVKMLDSLQFEPSSVDVAPGQTVTFKVTNTSGTQNHEFIIGDQKFQDEHEKEMQETSGGKNFSMADEPFGINIRPGQTEELTWKFPDQPGETIYFVCHEPGHQTTMKGEFKINVQGGAATTMPGGGVTTTMPAGSGATTMPM